VIVKKKPPTQKELLDSVNSDDLLTATLRGHQCIEGLLTTAISDALSVPHAVEVADLSFPLKVDLAVGLGMLDGESRGGFLRLNKIRNAFAHSRGYAFTPKDASDLLNALSPKLRHMLKNWSRASPEPESVLRNCIAVLFVHVQVRVERARDTAAANAELGRVIVELAETSPFRDHGHPETLARMLAAVDASRAKRREDGEP